MTKYISQGNKIKVAADDDLIVTNDLPVATYGVNFHPDHGYHLSKIEDMTLPSKLYGRTTELADRFIKTAKDRPGNTGVLLSGMKGTGKTLLLRSLCISGQALDMPTLVISTAHCGEAFNQFITSITQPVVVTVDEFEKMYNEEEQQAILSLLDGVFTSNKLFIFTVNDMSKVNEHLTNRPGRMYYHVKYGGLDQETISQYAQEHVKNKDHIEDLGVVATTLGAFTFDMLKALVEEMNRFDESARTAVKLLNIRPEGTDSFDMDAYLGDHKMKRAYCGGGNPLMTPVHFRIVDEFGEKDSDGDHPDMHGNVSFEDLKHHDVASGVLIFEKKINDKTYELRFKRIVPTFFDF